MRKANWILYAYSLAVAAVLITLWAGDGPLARGIAIMPFLLLMIGLAAGPRSRGWIWAAAGFALTALTLESFATLAGDTAGEVGLGLGTVALIGAMLRAGGWQVAKRHSVLLACFFAIAGLWAILSVVGFVTSLVAYLNTPPMCADTCMGPAIGLFASAVVFGEVLFGTLVAASFAYGVPTGLGALTTAVGANVLFVTLGRAAPTPVNSAGIVVWFAGMFVLASPWTRLRSEVAAESTR